MTFNIHFKAYFVKILVIFVNHAVLNLNVTKSFKIRFNYVNFFCYFSLYRYRLLNNNYKFRMAYNKPRNLILTYYKRFSF